MRGEGAHSKLLSQELCPPHPANEEPGGLYKMRAHNQGSVVRSKAMQGAWVCSLVWGNSTCMEQLKPVPATAEAFVPGTCALQQKRREVEWKSLSRARLFAPPWAVESLGFSRPGHCSGELSPSPGDLPNPWNEPSSPALQADSLPSEPRGKPQTIGMGTLSLLQWIFPAQESNWGLLRCRWIFTT